MDMGQHVQAIVTMVDSNAKDNPCLIQRAAGRMIEEMVELALACGNTSADIFAHVADALHNEARKAKVFPSELRQPVAAVDVRDELGDIHVQAEYLRTLLGISAPAVVYAAELKLSLLHAAALEGNLVCIDGCLYRKQVKHG